MLSYRIATVEDAEIMTKYRNENRIYFFDPKKLSTDETAFWLQNQAQSPNDFMYIVFDFDRDIQESIGQCSMYDIDRKEHCARFGRLIKYTKEVPSDDFVYVCSRIINDLSKLFNLERVIAETYVLNKSALTFFSKLGFRIKEKVGEKNESAYYVLVKNMI